MENIIEMFHIDIRIVIAQVINFGIVFFVLYRFVITPLQKVMKERTKKIEKSLEDAKSIDKKFAQAKIDTEKIIHDARKEANDILEQARIEADKKQEEYIDKAKKQITEIISQEKQKMQLEKLNTIAEIKSDIGSLVISTVEKIVGQKVNSSTDHELIKKIIAENK
ncbi:F0F1 ATP synthase subunit B [Patescibacteria group bacterium]|nr:F0F1 ATP synthase subunit B [Patescibacteria group bacterium]